jgi:undecaprenyl-diphosphatase
VLRENRAIGVLALLFCLFLGLTALARSEELLSWDRQISRAIQSARGPGLDALASALTWLGDGWPLSGVCLLGAAWLWRTNRPRAAALAAFCLTSVPLNAALKLWVARPRPAGDVRVLTAVSGTSFPSGHTMAACVVFGFAAFLAWVLIADRRRRLLVAGALAAAPVLVGWTRIYLGAHWFSDVIAGWTVGTFFVLLLAEIYKAIGESELTR